MSWTDEQGEVVPGDIVSFVEYLAKAVRDVDVNGIKKLYEVDYPALTDRLYKASLWPNVEAISPLVNKDENFLPLYKELYYRHVYSHCEPTIYDRFDSYQNYIDLFNIILGLRDDQPEIELCSSWMWSIVDEFVSQFQSFHHFRGAVQDLSEEETTLLKKHEHVWSAPAVLRYLHALAKKGGIDLMSEPKHDTPSVAPSSQHWAQFSVISLLRVNCLLGDYTSGLNVLDYIDFTVKNPYSMVISCYTTLYYFMGLSYMMLRRFIDAQNTCSYFILFVNRNSDSLNRLPKWQAEEVLDMVRKVYAIAAISSAVSGKALEDIVKSEMQDQFQQVNLIGITQGDIDAFSAMFMKAAPEYVCPSPPDYESSVNLNMDSTTNQQKLFLVEIQQRSGSQELSSHIKLCKTVTLDKLSSFLRKDEQSVMTYMLNLKHKTRNLTWNNKLNKADGEWCSSASVNFFVKDGVVNIVEHNSTSRPYEYFIYQSLRYQDIMNDLN